MAPISRDVGALLRDAELLSLGGDFGAARSRARRALALASSAPESEREALVARSVLAVDRFDRDFEAWQARNRARSEAFLRRERAEAGFVPLAALNGIEKADVGNRLNPREFWTHSRRRVRTRGRAGYKG